MTKREPERLYFIPSGQYIKGMATRSDGRATRERLLAAARKLVAQEGPSALTLDRAAEAAGISKGAVLYHFKSKDALIDALLRSVLDQFDAATQDVQKKASDDAGAYSRAYAIVSFHPRNNTPEVSAGLLAAVTNDISLLKPAVDRHAAYQRQLEDDGIAPAVATLIRLAAGGLYLSRAFGLAPPSDERTAEVLALLLNMISGNEKAKA
jgi:AcrR family transcriptional regulator